MSSVHCELSCSLTELQLAQLWQAREAIVPPPLDSSGSGQLDTLLRDQAYLELLQVRALTYV